jgi:hypothetical protein
VRRRLTRVRRASSCAVVIAVATVLGTGPAAHGETFAFAGLRTLGMSSAETQAFEQQLRRAFADNSPLRATSSSPALLVCADTACVCREVHGSGTEWAVIANVGRLDRIYSLELSLIDVERCRVASRASWTDELASPTTASGLRATVADLFSALPRSDTSSQRPAIWTLGGAAAALVGAGAFAWLAHSARRDLAALCLDSGNSRICPEQARGALAADRRWSILTDASLGASMALAGIGTYLLWRSSGDHRASRERVTVAPIAGAWSAGVVVHY